MLPIRQHFRPCKGNFLWDPDTGKSVKVGPREKKNYNQEYQVHVFYLHYKSKKTLKEKHVDKIFQELSKITTTLGMDGGNLFWDVQNKWMNLTKNDFLIKWNGNDILLYSDIVGPMSAWNMANNIHGLAKMTVGHDWVVQNPDELATFFPKGKLPAKLAKTFGVPLASEWIDPSTRSGNPN